MKLTSKQTVQYLKDYLNAKSLNDLAKELTDLGIKMSATQLSNYTRQTRNFGKRNAELISEAFEIEITDVKTIPGRKSQWG